MSKHVEPAAGVADDHGAEWNAPARRAMREARIEAVVILAALV